MYIINEENVKDLKGIKYGYYSEMLDTTQQHLCAIFNGKLTCSGLLAKGIISVFYNISLKDDRIEEYMKKYFKKATKE